MSILSETVVAGIVTANGSIIGALGEKVVVLHIVGEDHYLGDVEIATELGVLKALLHPVGLGLDPRVVILLLDFDECKRKTVDE